MVPPTPTLTLHALCHEREADVLVSSMSIASAGLVPDGRLLLRARVRDRGGIDRTATPFLPIATVLACALRADLLIEAPVDERALAGAKAAARVVADWFGWYPARVTAPRAPRQAGQATGTALFFSRGLDSMASLALGGTTLTHLVGIDWLDAPYASPPMEAVWQSTVRAAHEVGLPLVQVSTNARVYLDPIMLWDAAYGAVLASLGLLLAPIAREVRIASSYRADLEPSFEGSHRDLDPLWSSSGVEIVHDGAAGGRVDKARLLAGNTLARHWLKVCWERAGDGNCGRCGKCLMTMTNFLIADALQAVAPAFDAPLSPEAVRAVASAPRVALPNIDELLEYLPPGQPLHAAWTFVLETAQAQTSAAPLAGDGS